LGLLSGTNPRSSVQFVAFERRLKELGHVDGKNLIVDFAMAEGKVELLAPLARELVARKPDLLFLSGPEAPLKALSEVSGNIPIVVCAIDFDPAGERLCQEPGPARQQYHRRPPAADRDHRQTPRVAARFVPSARRIAVLADVFTGD
jgi:hypothetical protein